MTLPVETDSPGTASGRQESVAARVIAYGATVAAATIVALWFLRPWTYGAQDVAVLGGDQLWVQAMMQAHGQVGVFGVTDHLAWPMGASPWSLPQLGIAAGVFAQVMIGGLGLPVASTTTLFVAIAAGANAGAILFLLRSIAGRALAGAAGVLAVCLGASPWVLQQWGTINLSVLVIVPLALGVLVRAATSAGTPPAAAVAAVAIIAAVSPMWWVLVTAMILPFLVLAPLVRKAWRQIAGIALVWMGVVAGLAVQAALAAVAAGNMSDFNRNSLDSFELGGGLADLLRASPVLNGVVERLTAFPQPPEPVAGGVVALLAAFAVFALLADPPARVGRAVPLTALTGVTTVSLLYFLAGGLGQLQGALAFVLGTVSPARWWSRLLIVVAIWGAAWVVVALLRWRDSRTPTQRPWLRFALILGGVALTAGTLMDLNALRRDIAIGPVPEDQAAVAFLAESVSPCPVAQLPANGLPNSRLEVLLFDPLLYRGLMPYVLAPDFYWSAGSDQPDQSGPLDRIPTEIAEPELEALRNAGYCAVLYSKGLAAQVEAQGAALPGTRVRGIKPDFENRAFTVILLNQ